MGNDQQKQWMYDNVLFLDPSTPLWPPEEEGEKRHAAPAGRKKSIEEKQRPRGAKRHTPTLSKLRSRMYRISIDLDGRRSEFQLRCSVDPLHLIFCDRQGEPLREIPAARIRRLERTGSNIAATFAGLEDGSGRGPATVEMKFTFDDEKQCDSFCETVRAMYGIYVHEFGIARPGAGKETDKGKSQQGQQCPIHGDKSCACNFERPKISDYKLEDSDDEEETDGETQKMAELSQKFPVAIAGSIEAGSSLHFKDLSGPRAPKGKVIEWFVSLNPGTANFAPKPSFTTHALILADRHVGHYVRLRVLRRTESENHGKTYVYSLATKGPVTLNDQTARAVLKILLTNPTVVNVQLPREEIPYLYGVDPQLFAQQPFFDGQLSITRTAVKISTATPGGDPLERELGWNDLVPCRPSADEVKANAHEDLYLCAEILDCWQTPQTFHIAMPNESQRNQVYHALCFYRLSYNFSGFDRWFADLEQGNFSIFKQRYAKLWSEISWAMYSKLQMAAPSESPTPAAVPADGRSGRRRAVASPLPSEGAGYGGGEQEFGLGDYGGGAQQYAIGQYDAAQYQGGGYGGDQQQYNHGDYGGQQYYGGGEQPHVGEEEGGLAAPKQRVRRRTRLLQGLGLA